MEFLFRIVLVLFLADRTNYNAASLDWLLSLGLLQFEIEVVLFQAKRLRHESSDVDHLFSLPS
jgi:hypothetical protein